MLMCAYSTVFGMDVIGHDDGEFLMDVYAIIDTLSYDGGKMVSVQPIRSMAFEFDKNGKRIKYRLKKSSLSYLKSLSDYDSETQDYLEKTYAYRTKSNTLDEFKQQIRDAAGTQEVEYDRIEDSMEVEE
jgi:hypothetical protein